MKKKRERTYTNKIRNEKGDITTDSTEISERRFYSPVEIRVSVT